MKQEDRLRNGDEYRKVYEALIDQITENLSDREMLATNLGYLTSAIVKGQLISVINLSVIN